ncbi:sensor histidine kinase [Paenibacillus sp. PAMC21692]|uniref:sensor histidine kinase n=1 Tax=Paenibacillus sp. PAMC21692 TaxID=2762320 RepID=UPI00164D43A9|nr:sensor histidine kinase [Paenibacillus sp. PAMC21692]QNK55644.1 sensor histidine kinase [Paenibacillus sp. PAMC21692]
MTDALPHKIRFKMFIVIVASMLTVVLSISTIAFRYITNLLTEKQMSQMESYAGRQSDQLERILSGVKTPLAELAGKLAETDLSEGAVTDVLRMYQYSIYPFSRGMFFISPDRSIYESVPATRIPEHLIDELYAQAHASWQSLQSVGPYESPNKGLVLTISVAVNQGTETRGILAADLDLRAINEMIVGMIPDPSITTLVFNADGRPLISAVKLRQDEYASLYPQIREGLQQGSFGMIPLFAEHNEYIALFSGIGSQDWQLVNFVKKGDILAPVERLQLYTLYVGLFFILLSFVIAFFLARYIDRPISGLMMQMRRIQKGNLKLRVDSSRKDEFGTLADSFNVMLDRIEELIDDKLLIEKTKKHYELRALQAQINPHFLYNTLNSINVLVDLKRTDEIAKVLHALVHLLDYSMGKGEELTPLAGELQGLRHYVYLQQIRYRNKFDVRYEIDEDLLACRLPKLTLQPIMENAIFHGIKENRMGERGVITVGGEIENAGNVRLYVKDNGIGIPPKKLAVLLDPAASAPTPSKPFPRYSSIGLHNVHDRIKLQFGDAYGLKIESEEGQGTCVEIRFPVLKGDEKTDEQ